MNNQKYWEERQALNYSNNEKSIIAFHKELVSSFEKAKKEIQKVINEFYIRYADNNGMSYSKAQELLPKEEIGELKDYIAQVYATMGTKDINVINKSIRARVTRYEALQKQIEAIIDVLYEVDYKENGIENFKEIYKNSYYNTLYNIDIFNGFHTEFSILDIRDIETLIEYPFNGSNYSNRLWKQKDHMLTKLKENITIMLVQGRHPKTLSSDFAKIFKTKEYEAYRLLHTESSFIIEQGTFKAYKEDGIEEYQILATLDTKTSDICREQDNKVYKTDDYVTGSTAPPFHHFCRTTTAPYYGEYEGTRKARDPVTNKSYDVPSSISYNEWYDKYIKDNPEALIEEKKWKNRNTDKKQYKKYKEVLGKEAPKSLKVFQKLKYNNSNEWNLIKDYVKSRENNMISAFTPYSQYKEYKEIINSDIVGLTTSNGIKITGQSKHFIERVFGTNEDPKTNRPRSGVEINDIKDALLNGSVRIRKSDPNSIKFITDKCMVSVNPNTGVLIQTNP
ncbi:minor capsid protein [Clostridium tertium]|uniref:minor capsid protein n=1 Tax=Clostridium tertium TaxID=1559 RepID=UPI002A816A86|nr:minor capsid protein [Clostridium tertium]MDY4605407.1 minor capsid protein [Clostridium tertium]